LAILVAVRRFLGMGDADSRSLRFESYVHMQHIVRQTSIPFRRFLGDVRREFTQRLSAALHGTLGSYLRDALQKGSDDAVACIPIPRAHVFSSFLFFAWWSPLLLLRIYFSVNTSLGPPFQRPKA
jgi:hypothetical protein